MQGPHNHSKACQHHIHPVTAACNMTGLSKCGFHLQDRYLLCHLLNLP